MICQPCKDGVHDRPERAQVILVDLTREPGEPYEQ